eukprot:1158172-Pelagomonas_calceolata.AAC.6
MEEGQEAVRATRRGGKEPADGNAQLEMTTTHALHMPFGKHGPFAPRLHPFAYIMQGGGDAIACMHLHESACKHQPFLFTQACPARLFKKDCAIVLKWAEMQ